MGHAVRKPMGAVGGPATAPPAGAAPVATLMTGERPWLEPEARACSAFSAAIARTSERFHDEPCSAGIGNTVVPGWQPECRVSAVKSIGMPSRELFIIAACTAFWACRSASVAICIPMLPSPVALYRANSWLLPSPFPSIWWTFSSSVILPTRSATRLATGAPRCR
eukprot:SAG22_NODE_1326_length_4733_cov_7.209754_5_plen_166_part_00